MNKRVFKASPGPVLRSLVLPALLMLLISGSLAHAQRVRLISTPEAGLQPQAVIDSKGAVHLIYFKGDPKGGDIFYVGRQPGQKDFSKPIPVNSRPHTTMALGTIRGAQLAVGKNKRVHVVWDGMGEGVAAIGAKVRDEHPLFYTRLNETGTAFEPERNVITYAYGLDGGSSVAADPTGNVYAVWHAPQPGNTNGEAGRAVFVARSTDEGKSFQREAPAMAEPIGACACCGLRAFADRSGAVYILFRAASENVNRDEVLLGSRHPGADFEIANRHRWKSTTCPMSSAALTDAKIGTLAAWETANQVYFASIDPRTLDVSKPISPPGETLRKHPVAVANEKGETLLVWTEGTGWNKGGSVAWQLFDSHGKPTEVRGRKEGVPAWSFATAFPDSERDFAIIY